MTPPKKKTEEAAAPKEPKGPTNTQLAEAIRRLVGGAVNTEEQKQEILWLCEGKDPAKENAKLDATREG
jgi:hypothetical protein